MPVSPDGLHCVPPDIYNLYQPESFRRQRALGVLVKVAHDVHFALAAGTRTMAS